MCGYGEQSDASTNCWVANAVRDIFPYAEVGSADINPFTYDLTVDVCLIDYCIPLPPNAIEMIREFDACEGKAAWLTVHNRLKLKPFSFIIDVPEEVIEQIDISAVYEGHPTLEFVEI